MAAALLLGACDRSRGTPGDAGTDPGHAPARSPAARFEAGAATAGAPLPEAIARGLSTDARVLDCPQGVVDGRSAFRPAWVVAHPADLDGDGGDDWVVEGRHACLTGPSGPGWWVYAGGAGDLRLVGALGEARSLEIVDPTRGRLSDLRLRGTGGGDVLVRHDGAAYAPVTGPGR